MPNPFSYKIEHITFEDLLGEDSDVYIDIVPVAWLPFTVSEKLAQLTERQAAIADVADVTDAADAATPEGIHMMGEILNEVILDWNIRDRQGNPVDVGDKDAWKNLPPVMVARVMDRATEDTGDIPLVSDKLSSGTLPAVSPPNRAQRRASKAPTSQAGRSKPK